jgi:hypothetical protein
LNFIREQFFKLFIMTAPQFITDNNGKKLSVVLPIEDYNRMIQELDELEDIRLADESIAENETSIPIDDAFRIIEAKRKKR